MKLQKTLLAFAALTLIGCGHNTMKSVAWSDPTKVKVTGQSRAELLVQKCQQYLVKHSNTVKAYNELGLAFAQLGRENGDLANYDHARDSFKKAHELDGKDAAAMRNLAYVSTIFHDFHGAISWGEMAIKTHPQDPSAYGIVSDSHFELGDYDKATDYAQKMVDLKPDLSSYSRAAKLKWVFGDQKGAMLVMQKALNAGAPFAENTAWCSTMLGDMYFKTGALAVAEKQYKDSLNRLKDYRHACAGMARVCFAKNNLEEASQWMSKACIGVPPIPYVQELGEIYLKMGKPDLAKAQFDKVEATSKAYRDHGIGGDEVALANYWLDHTTKKREALDMMEAEAKEHTNYETWSTLAWAYYCNNKPGEAAKAMEKAMRTGVQDSLVFYRASKIASANGQAAEARRLALLCQNMNPNFSMWHKVEDLVAAR